MNRLKTLLVWLLLLAVPLQASAAVMQMSCGPMHHGSMQSVTAPGHEHHAATDAHADHHHDMSHHGMSSADVSETGMQTADASGITADPSGTCSACAACCVGAAVIPSKISIPSDFGPTTKIVATASSSFTGHIPAGPERPPRRILS